MGDIVEIWEDTIEVKNYKTDSTETVKKSEIYNFVGNLIEEEEIESLKIGNQIFTDDMGFGYLYNGYLYG